ncbi:MAG TPA: hypothetical protein VND64_33580 [Pirellulales bacterium]|nr:hypothetical protein [Pirellulales bacterium]
MRTWILLFAVSLATSCSKPTAPPAAGSPATASVGPSEAKPSDYYEALGGNLLGRAFSVEMLAAAGGGNSVENNFGTMGGTCKLTEFNSYRCTADEAGRRMRKLETELRALAKTCGMAVEPAEATATDDAPAGFKFHYSQGNNQGDVDATIDEAADQAEAKPDAGEVVYRVEVVVSETAVPRKP